MISQLFVLSNRGDTIINKDFRGDLLKNTPEIFFRHLKTSKEEPRPIFNVEGINFAFVRKSSLIIACTSRFNVSPAFLMEVLGRACKMIKDFCGVLNEESIRKNFTLVYEVLDEFIDFGFAQYTGTEQIRPFIINEVQTLLNYNSSFNSFFSQNTISSVEAQKPVGGKAEKKRKNEIFVDIYEKIYMLFNNNGFVINSGVSGCITMKSYLNGNPTLKMGLNDNLVIGEEDQNNKAVVRIDDCNFHESVNMSEFDINRTLKIAPPDGEFTAMNYRIAGDFNEPFRVSTVCDDSNPYRLVFTVLFKANFKKDVMATHLHISFKVPRKICSVHNELVKDKSLAALNQTVDYDEADRTVLWKMKKVPGQTELSLVSKIVLEQSNPLQARKQLGPVNLSFEIPMFNISNLKINFLKVDDSSSKTSNPHKWIRYIT